MRRSSDVRSSSRLSLAIGRLSFVISRTTFNATANGLRLMTNDG
jgi:hypothetical protein